MAPLISSGEIVPLKDELFKNQTSIGTVFYREPA